MAVEQEIQKCPNTKYKEKLEVVQEIGQNGKGVRGTRNNTFLLDE